MYKDWYDYTPTKPIATKGGIRSKAKGGSGWWSKRWYGFMETFRLGARLTRGRAYARKGQVVDVSIGPGLVRGVVQGSRRTPYKVTIRFDSIPEAGWERIAARLKEQLAYAAQLRLGEVPPELEEFFQAEGASLFPQLKTTDDMQCDCPDWSNPCKHIAALFYVLGDAFDRDPFLLLQLRGITREKLLSLLGDEPEPETALQEGDLRTETEPLPDDDRFYRGGALPDDIPGPVPGGGADAPLLRRLGDLPLWRGEESLPDALRAAYAAAAERGRALLEGGDIA